MNKLSHTANPVYNDHGQDPKIMAVVDRWYRCLGVMDHKKMIVAGSWFLL